MTDFERISAKIAHLGSLATNWQSRALRAEAELVHLRAWLDGNMTFYNTDEAEKPVLASASGRIWYHATDDRVSYPFSQVARGVQS